MKTIKAMLLLAVIFIMLISSSYSCSGKDTTIVVAAADEKVTPGLMNKSVEILSARLKTYNPGDFSLKITEKPGQIEVTVPDSCDIDVIERLLTQKGELSVYETYDRESSDLLLKKIGLSGLLYPDGSTSGQISERETSDINAILGEQSDNPDALFRWGLLKTNTQTRLYVLRKQGNPLLSGSDFNAISYTANGIISFTLKKEAAERWEDATSRNIGKVIAILIDDKVIADPVVRQIINSGNFEISGKFTVKECRFITALASNGELPVRFEVSDL